MPIGGAYRVAGLDEGYYTGELSKDGFSDAQIPARDITTTLLPGRGGIHVVGDVPARADARLNPWGRVRGRVVDEEGKPVAKVRVEISNVVGGDTVADERGEFSFSDLPPGSYTVVAKPQPETHMREGELVGTVPVYYLSATDLAEASEIPVGWGADVAGIELRLTSVPVHRVSGVVSDEAGKPVANAMVRLLGRTPPTRKTMTGASISGPGPLMRVPLQGSDSLIQMLTRAIRDYSVGPGREPKIAMVESRADGTFEFPSVQKGDWRVTAESDERRFGVASASVADEDVEGVQIRLSGQFNVEVSADWRDLQPPKPDNGGPAYTGFLVRLQPLEEQPQVQFNPEGGVTSIHGAFPGRYRVMASGPLDRSYYISSVTLGGTDVLGKVMDLTPGAGPFEAVIKHDMGSVRGTVENAEGASVYLVPQAADEVIHYVAISAGAGGSFEFKNVIPGDYYVVAFDRSDKKELPSQDLPYSIASLGSRVKVEPSAGATANVRANKSPW